MGDPRRLRKKYKRPNRPWEKTRLESEIVLLGTYGLRNKREIWRHANQLRRFRQIAREIKTMPEDIKQKEFSKLVGRLNRLGLINLDATTDDILSLVVKDILERRLQTIVYKKGLAKTIYQARQLVVHKHIAVNNKIIASPSYLVLREEENSVDYSEFSPFKQNPQKIFQPKKEEGKPKGEEEERKGEKESSKERTPRKKSYYGKRSSKKSTRRYKR